MPWIDRLREAALTSPGGTRLAFDFEDVSQEMDCKTSAFEFPDADGTYVQDLGRTGRRFPLRIFLWGDDYDQEADLLFSMLSEQGISKLEHPVFGVFDVVPFGTIRRVDNLKTEANQAVFEVTFFQTIGLVYPTPQTDRASQVIATVDEYNAAAVDDFGSFVDVTSAIQRINLESVVGGLNGAMAKAQDLITGAETEFNEIKDSIDLGIKTLVSDPLVLAQQTLNLIQAPARFVSLTIDRLSAYLNLASDLINTPILKTSTRADTRKNAFRVYDFYISSYISGAILSAVNSSFVTKKDAIEAAEDILNQFEIASVWREGYFEELDEIDPGDAYQKIQQAVALTAGFLVEISFSLKQERQIVLDRNRTIIDLSAELLGAVDSELDFLITSNNLTGEEIIELPAGKTIIYYV